MSSKQLANANRRRDVLVQGPADESQRRYPEPARDDEDTAVDGPPERARLHDPGVGSARARERRVRLRRQRSQNAPLAVL